MKNQFAAFLTIVIVLGSFEGYSAVATSHTLHQRAGTQFAIEGESNSQLDSAKAVNNSGQFLIYDVSNTSVGGLVSDPSNGFVYSSAVYSLSTLVINGTTVLATITPGASNLVYNSHNHYVYGISKADDYHVSVINGTKAIAEISVGYMPSTPLINPSDGFVYVFSTNRSDTFVSVVNGTSRVATVDIGAAASCLLYNPSDGYVYVCTEGGVSVIDGTSLVGRLVMPVTGSYNNDIIKWPSALVYDPYNGFVYLVDAWADVVQVINGTREIADIHGGFNCLGYSSLYDSRGAYLYLWGGCTGDITVIHGTSFVANVSTGYFPTGGSVSCLRGAFSPQLNPYNDYIYFSDSTKGTVTVISGTTIVSVISLGTNPGPGNLLVDPSNGYTYVGSFHCLSTIARGTLSVLSGADVVATLPVDGTPILYNPSNDLIYVSPHEGGLVVIKAPNSSALGQQSELPYILAASGTVALVLVLLILWVRRRFQPAPR